MAVAVSSEVLMPGVSWVTVSKSTPITVSVLVVPVRGSRTSTRTGPKTFSARKKPVSRKSGGGAKFQLDWRGTVKGSTTARSSPAPIASQISRCES